MNRTPGPRFHIRSQYRVAIALTAREARSYLDLRKSDDPFGRRMAIFARAQAVTKFDRIINGEMR